MITGARVVILHLQCCCTSISESPNEVGVVWAGVSFGQSNQLLSLPLEAKHYSALTEDRECVERKPKSLSGTHSAQAQI